MTTQLAGFSEAAISPMLLLFGCGLVFGNIDGGRLADRALVPAIFGTLLLLLAVLAATGPLLTFMACTLVAVATLGFAGFAPVAPLRNWVLRNATGSGENLASSFNIAAFNPGNTIDAGAGSVALDIFGLCAVTWAAVVFPLAALGVAAAAAHAATPATRERHA